MSAKNPNFPRWNRISIGFGVVFWLLLFAARTISFLSLNDLELLLLLAFLVITPLAIPLAAPRSANPRIYGWALAGQPLAALAAVLSFLAAPGLAAGILAAVWLLFTLVVAYIGLTPFLQKKRMAVDGTSVDEICGALALVYLPIGGLWFVAVRLGIQPLGFAPLTVLLTAVHFHYITLGGLGITASIGHSVRERLPAGSLGYRAAAIGMMLTPLLVAAGITLTQIAGIRALETVGALLLVISLTIVSLLGFRYIIPATLAGLAKTLLVSSSASVFVTMLFAAGYALGKATGAWDITISQMIMVHGWLNALGFSLCGLLGWRIKLAQAQPQAEVSGR